MGSLIGTHGLSYFQIVGLFLALAGGHFASTPDVEGIGPVAAFGRVFVSLRGYAAIALLSGAALVMVWPEEGRPNGVLALALALISSIVVGGFASFCALKESGQ